MDSRKENMVESGNVLRRLRGIRTRTGVSRELGIPYSTLQSYEDGKRTPTGRMKKKLADYYGVAVQDIFFETRYYKNE